MGFQFSLVVLDKLLLANSLGNMTCKKKNKKKFAWCKVKIQAQYADSY